MQSLSSGRVGLEPSYRPGGRLLDVSRDAYGGRMRLLHTSDWHVGRTFHGADTLPALVEVLAAMADRVRRERIDVVLVAGDVYDSAMPAGRHVEALTRALQAIRDAGLVPDLRTNVPEPLHAITPVLGQDPEGGQLEEGATVRIDATY